MNTRRKLIKPIVILASLLALGGCDNDDDCPDCSCFVGGTRIWTPTGDVDIEEIEVGSIVLAYDHKTDTVVPSVVTQTWVHPDKEYQWLSLPNGTKLGVTEEHPIFNIESGNYVPAASLTVDSSVMLRSAQANWQPATPVMGTPASLGPQPVGGGTATVYNISVFGHENYFANGLLVHNKTVSDAGVSDASPMDAQAVKPTTE